MLYTLNKRFLCFPISENAPTLTRMKLCVDDFSWIFDVQLVSPEDAEYWTYFDAKGFTGSSLALVSTSGVPEEEWKAWIMLSDDVPGEEDIYKEKDRPYYHFSNSRGWINDPNGMVRKDGRYHMFYQLNPFGTRGYDKGWGHAVSDNLFDWHLLPPALSADERGYSISGSALFDEDNLSGFGRNSWILAYSTRYHNRPDLGQFQNIAWSNDGLVFHKYDKNPVISDTSGLDFRDPKVFYHKETNRFVMIVAFGSTLRIYTSGNLKEWEFESLIDDSSFNPEHRIFECPELLEYKTEDGGSLWVLSFSWIEGRSVDFVFGSFDGKQFVRDPDIPLQRADWGKDFYAAVAYNQYGEMNGRTLWIGWMCYWPYSMQCPRNEGWLNLFTVPRDLSLVKRNGKYRIAQLPAKEIEEIVTDSLLISFKMDEAIRFPEAFRLTGRAENISRLRIEFSYDSGECVTLSYLPSSSEIVIDRKGANPYEIGEGFNEVLRMPYSEDSLDFIILGDVNSLEFYFDGGVSVLSLLCYSSEHKGCVRIEGDADIHGLKMDTLRRGRWEI